MPHTCWCNFRCMPRRKKIPTTTPPHFGVQLLNGIVVNTVGSNRKSEIKHGGRQTGSTFISAPRYGRNEIPNATPRLLGSSFSMELWSVLWVQTGSQKSNMAAAKPEVLISHVLQQIDTRFQRLYSGFRGRPTRRTNCRYPPMLTDTGNARWRSPNRK